MTAAFRVQLKESDPSEIRRTHNEKQSISRPRAGVCRLLKRGFHEMGIKTIPRSEFAQLLPHNPALESWMVEQVEWFSHRSGTLLGTIAKGKSVAGWNYVILERDKLGDFYVHKVMNNFFSSEAAKMTFTVTA
jgi:hypothetical protein